ncbi:hypothetical protein KGF57_003558 [Candida theae]|uniref:Probable guanine deaminase n=1 Tax=Candida theae TaxID=1198502 RepID=A0AAD5BDU9_9ASCO|nr:uncharacterized protein KGF57_003558 [Candida theae]KAI5956072.1 hypothetical protein KGF57_003558 [Candida theae]
MSLTMPSHTNESTTTTTTTTASPKVHIKATAPIPYTLYYGTFIHTPSLDRLEIHFNCMVGVNSNGVIDYMHKNYNPSDHDGQSPLEYFQCQHNQSVSSNANSNGDADASDVNFVDVSQDCTKFFFPGFIDTHIHASQFPNIGIGLDTPLLDWLNKYTFPLESQFCGGNENAKSSINDKEIQARLEFVKQVYSRVIQRTLSNGTTCASYFTTIDPETTNYFADLLLGFGQRGFVGKVCMDCNESYPQYEESLDTCVDSMNKIIEHLDDINPKLETLVKPIVTPRFAPVCSREMLAYLGKLSESRSLPIQTHISENKSEIEWVAQLFPDCDSYSQVYNKYNLLTESTILAHCIHLSPQECQLIAEKKCSVSHCPTSNTFISSGEAPIRKYLYDYNINVSLGTDVSGGFDSSILQIVKHAILVSHHLSMKEATTKDKENEEAVADFDCKLSMAEGLYMSTMGGARAVGLQDQIGSFVKGKKFDCQLIDLTSPGASTDVFSWQVPSVNENTGDDDDGVKYDKMVDLVGKWVFSGDDRNCVGVWCNGRQVVDKRRKVGGCVC